MKHCLLPIATLVACSTATVQPTATKTPPLHKATTFKLVPNPESAGFAIGDAIAMEGGVWHRICRAADVFTNELEKTSGTAAVTESTDVQRARSKVEANVAGIVQAAGDVLQNIEVRLAMKDVTIDRASVGSSTIYPSASCRQLIATYRKRNVPVAIIDATLRATSCTTFSSQHGRQLSASASQALKDKFGAALDTTTAANTRMTVCGNQLVWAVSLDTSPIIPAMKVLGEKEPLGDAQLVECDVAPDRDRMAGWHRVLGTHARVSGTSWHNAECETRGEGWAVGYGSCGVGGGTLLKRCLRVRVIPHGVREWSKESY